ncbi:MAG TPA: molybdopterin cofactor-binding domain-containing protein [Candidatus Methylomirabilis sp.]|nr:molybdopterin cofactor-binding domain-containing protein [Candidatus Methylomirabilis sp.]
MNALRISRRAFLKGGGALVVGVRFGPAWLGRAAAQTNQSGDMFLGKTVATDAVDGFLAIHQDGSVTLFSGKVDLGTGARAALRQMAAEELDVSIDRIIMIEGDTALTPDQGPTAGSAGVSRGGVQIRQAAATARQALLSLASRRLGRPAADLEVVDGLVRPRMGGASVSYGELVGDRRLSLAVDPKAPLKDPKTYRVVGKPVKRPDVPAKVTGRHVYVHDLSVPGMLHGRVIRPPAIGATLLSVDESSIASIPGARIVRVGGFLGVVAEAEWNAVRAARHLKTTWSSWAGLPEHAALFTSVRGTPVERDETIAKRGDLSSLTSGAGRTLNAVYQWPIQTHGSIGPSCAVADVRPDRATIWTASQATHKFQPAFARILGLPREKVRLIYLDGSGCYGMNGHEDAAADAALMSKAVGRPVRVQWTREDEHGWDPKGPPQLLELRAAVDASGQVIAWDAQAWLPAATAGLPNIPLLAPQEAGIPQPLGRSAGLIQQNVDPPYQFPNVQAVVHWLKDTPLRPSNIRAPGKVANSFATESFTDEVAALVHSDPLALRQRYLTNPRGQEVLRRLAARMAWVPRPSPRQADPTATFLTGRGLAYVHYKHSENHVAMGMEVEVERGTGRIRVTRVVCAHDCGLMINPDCVQSQLEGSILQSISRTLLEEVTFDRSRVTSLDWSSYPILTFPDAPVMEFELIDRPDQPPMGVGEAASTPVPAALANAVFDATGVRLRSVPFRAERVKAALEG